MLNLNQNLKKNADTESNSLQAQSLENPWKVGLLCVFLGTLGVHNFYIGNRNKGLLQIFWLPILLLSFVIFKINEMSGFIFFDNVSTYVACCWIKCFCALCLSK